MFAGMRQTISLPHGPIDVRIDGDGPTTLVFLHGLLVDGSLWRHVVPGLAADARCIVPDLPLGSHRSPLRADADLTPPGLARLVADLLAELDLRDVTLVANDTGGAIAQLVVTRHPDRVGRLVLTSCDAFDNFPPPLFKPLVWAGGRVPGMLAAIGQATRPAAVRRSPLAYGWLARRPIPDEVTAAWLRPARADRAVRRDLRRVLAGIDSRYTVEAAERLRDFDRPTLIAWATEDRFFPREHADRLAERLPDGRVEDVADSYTFVPEDQPEHLVRLIASFTALGRTAPPATRSA